MGRLTDSLSGPAQAQSHRPAPSRPLGGVSAAIRIIVSSLWVADTDCPQLFAPFDTSRVSSPLLSQLQTMVVLLDVCAQKCRFSHLATCAWRLPHCVKKQSGG